MKVWPLNQETRKEDLLEKSVPKKQISISSRIPQKGEAGSFWEDRGDRYHCGVDLYTPENTKFSRLRMGLLWKQVL